MAQEHSGKAHAGTGPENYERHFVPAIGAPLARELMKVAALRTGERVLDVACGTGVVTRLAAQQVGAEGKVTGLDLNPGMLAVAQSAAPPGAGIDWLEAGAEEMPLPDASFDVVLCQMGLQFVPDRPAALREMHRVLAPGGRLILNLPGPTPALMAVMGKALAQHVGAEAEGFVQHVFSLHDTTEVQKLLEDAGFQEVIVRAGVSKLRVPPPQEFLWGYVQSTPIAGALAKVDDARRGALERDVLDGWKTFVNDGAMQLDVRMVVATARKE